MNTYAGTTADAYATKTNEAGLLSILTTFIASILIASGAFFPYISVSVLGFTDTISLLSHTVGTVIIILAGIGFFSSLYNFLPGTILAGIGGIIISLGSIFYTNANVNSVFLKGCVHYSIGFYSLLIGAAALIIIAIFSKINK